MRSGTAPFIETRPKKQPGSNDLNILTQNKNNISTKINKMKILSPTEDRTGLYQKKPLF